MGFILGVVVGLVVGWNFLKQPAVVAEWIAKIRTKLGA